MPAKKSSTVTLTSKEFEELKELARLPNESPNPVIRISTTGKLLFASKFAYTIDRMIDPKTDQVAPELMKAAKASFKDGKTTRVDYIDDGVIYELFISPVKEHGYINLYGRDVTEIRETMAQVKDLAKFPSENPNPVVRSSSDGSVLFANDAARALNGIILAGPPEKLTKALSQAAQSASKLKIFVKVNHTSGGQTYLFTFMPVKGEAYLNVYGREITAEIEAQNALKESNAQLEKRVAERTASVRLLQNIVLAANSADSLEAALQTALHEVCIYTGWPVGHAYVVERQEDHIRLIPTGLWHIETSTKYSDLRAATETHRFGEADGLPGRAIRSGQAEWVEYLSRDKKSVRATFAKQAGLSSGMAFPVVSDGIVIGVLEFFSQKRTAANVEIIETMGHIGTQLGSVAKRKNAENAAASSQKEAATAHARLSNAIDVMAQGFVLFDKDDRIVLFNKGYSDFIVDFSGEAPATGDTFEEIIRSSSKFAGERLSNDERDQSIKRVLSDRKASKVENTVQRTSSGRWLQIEGFDTAEGGAVSVFTDITETKEHEQELGRLADQADLAHARLRDAIESIGQGFALFDADDRIVLFNERYRHLITKLTSEPSVGAQFSDMLRATERTDFKGLSKEDWMKKVMAERAQPGPRHSINKLPDGTWYKAEGFHTSDGGNVSIFTDITDLKNNEEKLDNLAKEAELAHARLSDAIEAIGQGFVLFDADDRFVLFNKKYQKMMNFIGHDPKIGDPFRSVVDDIKKQDFVDETREQWIERTLKIRKEEEIRSSTEQRSDGSWYLSEGFRTVEGGIVSVFTDVTEMKKHEADLDALVNELGVARDAAVDASSAKSQFLANMSHELRTPLNAIIGYSELLIDDATDDENEDYIPDLEKIQSAGKHLLGLINDILDLSKIEVGKIELFLEEFEIPAMLEDVANTIKPLVQKNNNTLVLDISPDIGLGNSDITKLRQNLYNLLSNAAKFSKDSTLTLRVRRQASDAGDLIVFDVEDQGIGMSPEQLDKIFDPFTQADSSTSKRFGGTGLGLTITREFSRMLGGDITVTSTVDVGTTFTMTVLAEVSSTIKSENTEKVVAKKTVGGDAPLVLIIDDDHNVRDLLQRNLSSAGYRTETAKNGEEGLKKALELQPSAITLDVIMPKADGWSVLASLKSLPETENIPVIMVTIVEDKKLGFSLGASDYLSKPVDRKKLVNVLEKFLGEAVNRTILLVEDDENNRSVIRRILEKEGVKLIEAENGRVGIEKLKETKPALILLDLMMPELDGFGFIDEYQKNPEWHDIPIVVVTAKVLTKQEKLRLEGWVEGLYSKLEHSADQVLKDICSRLPPSS